MRRGPLAAILLALALAVPVEGAAAATRYVSLIGEDNPTCLNPALPCRHVQHAADQASGGDVVQIGPGLFSESVIVIDRALTFVGAGSGTFASDAGATVVRPPAAADDFSGHEAFELRRGGTLRSLRVEGGRGGNAGKPDKPGTQGGVGVEYFGTEPGQSSLLIEDAVVIGGQGGSGLSPGFIGKGIQAISTVGKIELRVLDSEVTMGGGSGGFAVTLSGSSTDATFARTRIGDGRDDMTGLFVGVGATGALDSVLVDADNGASTTNGSLTIDRSRLVTKGLTLDVSSVLGPVEATVRDSLLISEESSAVGLHGPGADPATATIAGSTLIGKGNGGALSAFRPYPAGTAQVEATLRNSIVRELPKSGPATDISAYGGAIVTADHSSFSTSSGTYTAVAPEPGSAGNVAGDPLFVDPSGDFALRPGSPLIDRGDPLVVTAGQLDLAGNPRSLDGNADCVAVPDIGAFELAGHGCVDDPPPTVRGFRMTNRAFAPKGKGKRRRARAGASAKGKRRRVRRGTAFVYRLSEPARVTIAIERRAAGRKVRRKGRTRCVKPRRGRARPRCVRWARAGALSARRQAGRQTTPFSGRIRGRALRPGRYRATIVATDSAGQRSQPRRVGFRVVRG